MTLSRARSRVAIPSPAAGRARPRIGAGALLWSVVLAVLFLVVFEQTFRSLWRTWMNNPSYSHGALVPLISAALVWMKRRELGRLPITPSAFGLPVMAVALVLQLAGLRGDVLIFQGDALILVLAGLALHFLGWRWMRALAFPIAYLVFMVPFLPVFESQVSFRLKQLAASGAVEVSSWIGVLVERDGMSLHLPAWGDGGVAAAPRVLRIENACSGMQSLISLLAMGALFAYFAGAGPIRRVALFAASVPIALVVNVVRISALCIVANATTVEAATGLFHDVSGFVLFAVALAMLLGVRKVLRA